MTTIVDDLSTAIAVIIVNGLITYGSIKTALYFLEQKITDVERRVFETLGGIQLTLKSAHERIDRLMERKNEN